MIHSHSISHNFTAGRSDRRDSVVFGGSQRSPSVCHPDLCRTVHMAIPSMGEAGHLPATIDCITNQRRDAALGQTAYSGYRTEVWICVNQPDIWWEDNEKVAICIDNRKTLEYLKACSLNNLHIIDRSSPGNGWTGKNQGVGIARKVLMDKIAEVADDDDIIISMDADTAFGPDFISSVVSGLSACQDALALSNPYYHCLSGNETLDRAMLRYEIYMRYYAVNMWRVGSPYSFTALGSAISLFVSTYRKIGGITAKKSGEDFYLLQKIRKAGWILNYNKEKVYPATRLSDRVFFGTGPALIKGSQGNWDTYPIYDHMFFNQLKQTYDLFPALFNIRVKTPMDDFLHYQFKNADIFDPLRKNSTNVRQFIRACHHKIDGLRVLQFLKYSQGRKTWSDEANLKKFLKEYYLEEVCRYLESYAPGLEALDFATSSIAFLDKLRNFLFETENQLQKTDASKR